MVPFHQDAEPQNRAHRNEEPTTPSGEYAQFSSPPTVNRASAAAALQWDAAKVESTIMDRRSQASQSASPSSEPMAVSTAEKKELQNVVGTLQRTISSGIDVSDSACDDRPKWWCLCRAHPLFQQRGSEATAVPRTMYSMLAV